MGITRTDEIVVKLNRIEAADVKEALNGSIDQLQAFAYARTSEEGSLSSRAMAGARAGRLAEVRERIIEAALAL